jgi:hypothetical protein
MHGEEQQQGCAGEVKQGERKVHGPILGERRRVTKLFT